MMKMRAAYLVPIAFVLEVLSVAPKTFAASATHAQPAKTSSKQRQDAQNQAIGVAEAIGPQAISAKDDLIKCMETFPNYAPNGQAALRAIVGHYP